MSLILRGVDTRDGENCLAVFRFLVRVFHENLYNNNVPSLLKVVWVAFCLMMPEQSFLIQTCIAQGPYPNQEIGKATYIVLFYTVL